MQKLFLTNTLSHTKKAFVPLDPCRVLLYVCGITPYSASHLGHARCYTTFDVLYRLLTMLGYTVSYCRNITDIDDKLLRKAEHELGNQFLYRQIAKKYMRAFEHDMDQLNCLKPTIEPSVTDNIDAIIDFIQALIDKGHAYRAGNNVYFSVRTYKDYGKLSRQKLHELHSGVRVDSSQEKKDPLDFALWKSEPENMFWQSPWGWGRPGWHIECSALAFRYLGPSIDIHAGGLDLSFPHHENEIAQSEARFNVPFARYWLHNGLVSVDKQKMSKSLGNVLTIASIIEQYDPMVLRFYLLSHHYRSPIDFSLENLAAAQKTYRRLCTFFDDTEIPKNYDCQDFITIPLVEQMLTVLCDDLNSQGMFGILFESLDTIGEAQRPIVKHFLKEIVGLSLIKWDEKKATITPEIQSLIEQRDQARARKDWKKADQLRLQLENIGVKIHDHKIE
jgi:cysteinyl-tRNA synthetase